MEKQIPEFYVVNLAEDNYCTGCKKIYPKELTNTEIRLCGCDQNKYPVKKFASRLICDYCHKNYAQIGSNPIAICEKKLKEQMYTLENIPSVNSDEQEESSELNESADSDDDYAWNKNWDACLSCFRENQLQEIVEVAKLKARPDTIRWELLYKKRVGIFDFYVVYEHNQVSYAQDCEYYLFGVRNYALQGNPKKPNTVCLNWKIQSYNPYAGVDVMNIELVEKPGIHNHVQIEYEEKHYVCKVTLEMDWNSQIESVVTHGVFNASPVGQVVKFIKDGKQMPNCSYW